MKVYEIVQAISQNQHGIKDMSVFDGAVQFNHACVEKYPLLYVGTNTAYYFCIEVDNTKVAYLIAAKSTYSGKPCLNIKRTWVLPEYRNRGFMKALYNTLHNQGFVLLSDESLSPESISIWRALRNLHDVKVIDVQSSEITRPVADADFAIYNSDTRFIIEQYTAPVPSKFGMPVNTLMNELLLEYEYYIDNKYKE